jgi:hypothetical protein
MDPQKPRFVRVHRKLIASIVAASVVLGGFLVYANTVGITINGVNVSFDMPRSSAAGSLISSSTTEQIQLETNVSVIWQGNGTINIAEFLDWLNTTVYQPGNNNEITPQLVNIFGNYSTFSPSLITVNYMKYSNCLTIINAQFKGNFRMQAAWGIVNTNDLNVNINSQSC